MIQGKKKYGIGTVAAICMLAGAMLIGSVSVPVHVQAQEDTPAEAADGGNQTEKEGIIEAGLMMTSVDTAALEAPDENAAVAAEFPAGTQIMVTGQENGWYAAFYQGKTIYLAQEDLAASTAVDPQALEKEMKKAEAEGAAYIESLEMQRKALKRSQVWRAVIIVLIAAIFVVGIASTLKNVRGNRKNGKESKGKRARS